MKHRYVNGYWHEGKASDNVIDCTNNHPLFSKQIKNSVSYSRLVNVVTIGPSLALPFRSAKMMFCLVLFFSHGQSAPAT